MSSSTNTRSYCVLQHLDDKQCSKLIRMFHANECLWNSKCSGYHNHAIKENAWKRIALLFNNGYNADQIKNQMSLLRNHYKQEKRIVSRSTNKGLQYEPKFPFFYAMSFLDEPGKSEGMAQVEATTSQNSSISKEQFPNKSNSNSVDSQMDSMKSNKNNNQLESSSICDINNYYFSQTRNEQQNPSLPIQKKHKCPICVVSRIESGKLFQQQINNNNYNSDSARQKNKNNNDMNICSDTCKYLSNPPKRNFFFEMKKNAAVLIDLSPIAMQKKCRKSVVEEPYNNKYICNKCEKSEKEKKYLYPTSCNANNQFKKIPAFSETPCRWPPVFECGKLKPMPPVYECGKVKPKPTVYECRKQKPPTSVKCCKCGINKSCQTHESSMDNSDTSEKEIPPALLPKEVSDESEEDVIEMEPPPEAQEEEEEQPPEVEEEPSPLEEEIVEEIEEEEPLLPVEEPEEETPKTPTPIEEITEEEIEEVPEEPIVPKTIQEKPDDPIIIVDKSPECEKPIGVDASTETDIDMHFKNRNGENDDDIENNKNVKKSCKCCKCKKSIKSPKPIDPYDKPRNVRKENTSRKCQSENYQNPILLPPYCQYPNYYNNCKLPNYNEKKNNIPNQGKSCGSHELIISFGSEASVHVYDCKCKNNMKKRNNINPNRQRSGAEALTRFKRQYYGISSDKIILKDIVASARSLEECCYAVSMRNKYDEEQDNMDTSPPGQYSSYYEVSRHKKTHFPHEKQIIYEKNRNINIIDDNIIMIYPPIKNFSTSHYSSSSD